MTVRFGLALPQAGSSASAEGLALSARVAEELGYDSIWLGDHVVVPEDIDSTYPYGSFTVDSRETYFEPLGTLGYLAGATSRIQLGLSILIVPLREPVSTAKQLATIDRLTGGRVILGVGSGWLRSEFLALGFSDDHFASRGKVLDESIDLYRELWAHRQTSAFEGTHFTLPPVRAFPKPVSPSGIPILAGGNTPPALRRAARLDGWHGLRVSVDEFARAARQIRELRDEAGETTPPSLTLRCFVGEHAVGDSNDFTMTGSPDLVAEKIGKYVDAGCGHFIFDLQQWPADSVDAFVETAHWFAETVRPLLPGAVN